MPFKNKKDLDFARPFSGSPKGIRTPIDAVRGSGGQSEDEGSPGAIPPNWEATEEAFRAGSQSLREIPEEHGVTRVTKWIGAGLAASVVAGLVLGHGAVANRQDQAHVQQAAQDVGAARAAVAIAEMNTPRRFHLRLPAPRPP